MKEAYQKERAAHEETKVKAHLGPRGRPRAIGTADRQRPSVVVCAEVR